MTSIGGPGGVGGPKGPSGPSDVGAIDEAHGANDAAPLDRTAHAAGATGATGVAGAPGELDAIVADLAAGRLTPHEAVDRLLSSIADSAPLAPSERAELRGMLADLVANDPNLAALIGRIA